MSNDPSLNSKQVVKILESIGFVHKRTKGSHATYFKKEAGAIVVPLHGSKDLARGTLLSVIKSSGLSKNEFFNKL